ncbi:hypothetical protein Ahy_B04g073498 isoform B [Arachis hypogaea]|uniref:Uncharacterized protein n=1 Tax=Arachis hypogaea TaxID=3818 RepID=A0A444ZQJ6_ARAHY|nr:hypothetical protein Ahy_B04g073498 isoform B [Arachis hypogaea]
MIKLRTFSGNLFNKLLHFKIQKLKSLSIVLFACWYGKLSTLTGVNTKTLLAMQTEEPPLEQRQRRVKQVDDTAKRTRALRFYHRRCCRGLSVIVSTVLTSKAIFQRMKIYTIYTVSITIRIVVVEIGKDNEGDIGFRRGDARHYTLYTGILGNILSSDFLAQVPAFQYQYPVITDVNI